MCVVIVQSVLARRHTYTIHTYRKTHTVDQTTVDQILAQDRAYLLRKTALITDQLNPCHEYRRLRESGYGAWATVLLGLSSKLTDTRKRARNQGFDIDIGLRDLARLWLDQAGCCDLTAVIMSFDSGSLTDKNPLACSIDRFDNSRGYLRSNVRLVTHWANNTKSTWDQNLFDRMIDHAYRRRILLEA